jgi:hypothetical protein
MSRGRFNPDTETTTPFRRGGGREEVLAPPSRSRTPASEEASIRREETKRAFSPPRRGEGREVSRGEGREVSRGRGEGRRISPERDREVSRGEGREVSRGRVVSPPRREASRGRETLLSREEPQPVRETLRQAYEEGNTRATVSRLLSQPTSPIRERPITPEEKEYFQGRTQVPSRPRAERSTVVREALPAIERIEVPTREVLPRRERSTILREALPTLERYTTARETLPTRQRTEVPAREVLSTRQRTEIPSQGRFTRGISPVRETKRSISPPPVRLRISPNFKPIIRTQPKPKIKLTSLDDNVLRIVASFLPQDERVGLSPLSRKFNQALLLYPIDLSKRETTLAEFLQFFGSRPTANVTNLWLTLLPSENLDSLLPFLPRLKTLKLSNNLKGRSGSERGHSKLDPLKECKSLATLSLGIDVFNYDILPFLPNLVYLELVNNFHEGNLTPLESCKKLRKLIISHMNDDNIMEVAAKIPELISLEVTKCNVEKNEGSLENFRNLQDISLNNCLFDSNISLISKCRTLTKCKIVVSDNSDVVDKWDISNLLSCPNLEDIDLDLRSRQSHRIIETNLLSRLLKLRKFSFAGSTFAEDASFENFPALQELYLSDVYGKIHIPKLPTIMERKNPDGSGFITGLRVLHFQDSNLTELPELTNSSELREVKIYDSPVLKNINFLAQCPKLVRATFNHLAKGTFTEWNFLKNRSFLTNLTIILCSIENFLFLEGCTKLKWLTIDKAAGLASGAIEPISSEGLRYCPLLEELKLEGQYLSFKDILGLAFTPELKIADLGDLSEVKNFTPFAICTKLRSLKFYDASSLQNLNFLLNYTQLEVLHVQNCENLTNITALSNCKKLKELELSSDKIVDISPIGDCENLRELELNGCFDLPTLKGVEKLKNLTKIDLSDCDSLKDIDPLAGCSALEEFSWEGTGAVENIDNDFYISLLPLAKCPRIRRIYYKGQYNLTDLRELLKVNPPNLVKVTDAFGLYHFKKNGVWNLDFEEPIDSDPKFNQKD